MGTAYITAGCAAMILLPVSDPCLECVMAVCIREMWMCVSRSAVDIVKIASETIEGLFNMRLALPVALVRALTEGLDEVLRK